MAVPTPFQNNVRVAEGSVLFISAHIEPTHPNYGMYRPGIDPPPDLDLNRLLDTAGQWTRRLFASDIIDAPSKDKAIEFISDDLLGNISWTG